MFKTIIKHYLYDIAIGIMFDNIYKNTVISRMTPSMMGKTVQMQCEYFTLFLYNVEEDLLHKYGNFSTFAYMIVNDVLNVPQNKIKDVIHELYGIDSDIVFH